MKPSEATQLLQALMDAYPRQAIGKGTAAIYAEMFADLEFGKALAAVKAHIATSPYFPAIAEIRKAVAETGVQATGAEEGWLELKTAFRRNGHMTTPKWSSPIMAKTVDALGGWRELCNQPTDQDGVLRAHFMRIFEAFRSGAVRNANVGSLVEYGAAGALPSAGAVVLELSEAKKLKP